MMKEIVGREADRIGLGARLNKRISHHEEVRSGQDRLALVNTERFLRNLNNPRRRIRMIHIERRGQRLHVNIRHELGGRENNELIGRRESRHTRGIIIRGKESKATRRRAQHLESRAGVRGRRVERLHIRALHAENTRSGIHGLEKGGHEQEFIPLVGRRRRGHDLGDEIGQTAGFEESAAQNRLIHGHRIIILAIHSVKSRTNVQTMLAENLLLEIIAAGRVLARLNEARLNLFDLRPIDNVLALENRERVRPDLIPGDHERNTVNKRVAEFIVKRPIPRERAHELRDIRLRRRRNTPLIIKRRTIPDRIQYVGIVGVDNLARIASHGHSSSVKRSSIEIVSARSSSPAPASPESPGESSPTRTRRS